MTPNDIPAGPNFAFNRSLWTIGPQEPLFAHDTVEYVGQPLGLVVASTLSAARAGAARVGVRYGPVRDLSLSTSNGVSKHSDGGQAATQSAAAPSAAAAGTANGLDAASADVRRGSDSSAGKAGAGGDNDWQAGGAAKQITSLNAAIKANSWYDLSKFRGSRACKGETE